MIEVSARTGIGLEAWYELLEARRASMGFSRSSTRTTQR